MKERRVYARGSVFAVALLLVLMTPGAIAAHEGHKHQVKGTVASVAETKLVVETTDGERNLYALSERTKFLRGKERTTREAIVVGERVVVTFELKEGAEWALEVRLGAKKP